MARWRCLECPTSGISSDGLQALADYYTHYRELHAADALSSIVKLSRAWNGEPA